MIFFSSVAVSRAFYASAYKVIGATKAQVHLFYLDENEVFCFGVPVLWTSSTAFLG